MSAPEAPLVISKENGALRVLLTPPHHTTHGSRDPGRLVLTAKPGSPLGEAVLEAFVDRRVLMLVIAGPDGVPDVSSGFLFNEIEIILQTPSYVFEGPSVMVANAVAVP